MSACSRISILGVRTIINVVYFLLEKICIQPLKKIVYHATTQLKFNKNGSLKG